MQARGLDTAGEALEQTPPIRDEHPDRGLDVGQLSGGFQARKALVDRALGAEDLACGHGTAGRQGVVAGASRGLESGLEIVVLEVERLASCNAAGAVKRPGEFVVGQGREMARMPHPDRVRLVGARYRSATDPDAGFACELLSRELADRLHQPEAAMPGEGLGDQQQTVVDERLQDLVGPRLVRTRLQVEH